MFGIIYNKMVKISSSRNFQYKIVKSIVLSILIPAAIILFSAWYFFGDFWIKSDATPTASTTTDATPTNDTNDTNNADLCKGMTQYTCNLDMCSWDPTQNMCLASK
jgi:hypothetical protein